MSKKGAIGGGILGFIFAVAFILVLMCSEKVPTGHVGVVYNMNGGVDGEILTQGWHIVSPTKKVTTYSIGIEQSYLTAADKGDSRDDESFSTPTSDGKSLTVDLEFSYKFDEARVAQTFTQFKGQSGKDVKDTFIKPKMVAWTQEVTAKYPVTDVFGDKRQELNEALDVYLKQKFEPYGIIIDTVNFTNISTDEETQAAIQKKVNAQQTLELSQIEAETAKVQAEKDKQVALIQAEKDRETALIEAEKVKIKAEAEADATIIEAEAEAEAIRLVSDALTDKYNDYCETQRWDGEYPEVVGSDATIVDIGGN